MNDQKAFCINGVTAAEMGNCSAYCSQYGRVGFNQDQNYNACSDTNTWIVKDKPNLPSPAAPADPAPPPAATPTTCKCGDSCVGLLQGKDCNGMSTFLGLNCVSIACSVNSQVNGGVLVPAGTAGASSLISATTDSVVSKVDATLVAF